MGRQFLSSTPSWWSSSSSSLWKLKESTTTRSRPHLDGENGISRTYPLDQGVGTGSVNDSGRFSSRPQFVLEDSQQWAHVQRMWTWSRFGFGAILLGWSTYCAVRYFIAVREFDDDHVRTDYAIGLGTVSILAALFYLPSFLTALFPRQAQSRINVLLNVFAAVLLIVPTVFNLVLLNDWRFPRSSDDSRTIRGRCHWDIDVVWSGRGQSCAADRAAPFGAWLAASICRFIISLIAVALYTYVTLWKTRPAARREQSQHTPSASQGAATPLMRNSMAGVRPSPTPSTPSTPYLSSSRRPAMSPVLLAETRSISEEELQRRSLSFTIAGQVLSRVEQPYDGGSDDGESEDEEEERLSRASSERPGRTPTPPGRRSSTSLSGHEARPSQQRVQVVGAYVHRMSTIDSIGSSTSPMSGRDTPASDTKR